MRFMSVFQLTFDGGEEPISGPFSLLSTETHRATTMRNFSNSFCNIKRSLSNPEEDKSITSSASFCDTDLHKKWKQ